jgi:hypothetical protein
VRSAVRFGRSPKTAFAIRIASKVPTTALDRVPYQP